MAETETETESKVFPLLEALTVTLTALENDSIDYDPDYKSTNNCGLLVQAVLGINKDQLDELYLDKLNKDYAEWNKGWHPTWTGLVIENWPLTGEPIIELFDKLKSSGANREDIPALDYLSDQEILKGSGVVFESNYYNVETVTETRVLFLFKRNIKTVRKVEVKFYDRKDNLILYLRSWIKLLKQGKKVKSKSIIVDGETFVFRITLPIL